MAKKFFGLGDSGDDSSLSNQHTDSTEMMPLPVPPPEPASEERSFFRASERAQAEIERLEAAFARQERRQEREAALAPVAEVNTLDELLQSEYFRDAVEVKGVPVITQESLEGERFAIMYCQRIVSDKYFHPVTGEPAVYWHLEVMTKEGRGVLSLAATGIDPALLTQYESGKRKFMVPRGLRPSTYSIQGGAQATTWYIG